MPKHAHVQLPEVGQWLGIVEQLEALDQVCVIYTNEAVELLDPQTVMRRADDQLPQILGGAAPLAALKVHETYLIDVARHCGVQQYIAGPEVTMIKHLKLLWIAV